MMAKPMKTLQLHYPMIQFLIDAIYLRATREKLASRFASVTSEEIIQINFFVVDIISLLVYTKTHIHLISTSTSMNSC